MQSLYEMYSGLVIQVVVFFSHCVNEMIWFRSVSTKEENKALTMQKLLNEEGLLASIFRIRKFPRRYEETNNFSQALIR